jgi:energy-coupling factor transporter ATP-binding protein EcfA2
MIELRGVSYRYPGHRRAALRDVDLVLHDGEVVGLAGANDAGKSTLCLVAAGLAPAAIGGSLDGIVLVDGAPIRDQPAHRMAERTGIVFADPTAQRSGVAATVLEEVLLGPVNLGCRPDASLRRARQALDRLGILALAGRDPGRLSGGQAQLVAIAAMLAMAPRHLVLDEPAAQLDAEGTALVAGALADLAAAGTALLIAEHRTDLLAGIATRLITLDDGAVAIEGRTADVLADPILGKIGVAVPEGHRLAALVAASGRTPRPEADA